MELKRLLALIMAAVMVASMCPLNAFAADVSLDEGTGEDSQNEGSVIEIEQDTDFSEIDDESCEEDATEVTKVSETIQKELTEQEEPKTDEEILFSDPKPESHVSIEVSDTNETGKEVESGSCGENAIWVLNDGVLTISGTGPMTRQMYNGSPLAWPWKNKEYHTVIVEDGITLIGNGAFYQNDALTTVTIADSVREIETYAFGECTNLTTVTMSANVTTLGDSVFYVCSSLSSITIPDGVKTIPDYAFCGCSSLTTLIIPDGVTDIGKYAFNYLINLESLTMPISATMTSSSFLYVNSLNSLTLTKGSGVCPSFTEDTCVYTPWYVSKNSNITVVLEEDITNVGDYAFFDCSGLSSITLPNSILSIGNNAFNGCSGLTEILIPSNTTNLGEYVFSGCSSLESVLIPDSVASLGNSAFSGCAGLTDITIGNGVSTIGSNAFNGCASLAGLVIPDNVTEIQSGAFSGCAGLTDITIGNGVSTIGSNAFNGCTSLAGLVIPDNVTEVQSGAFSGCTSLTNAFVGSGIVTINENMFSGCTGLINVTLPDNVSEIGYSAFSGCNSLSSLMIPDQVTRIGSNAFAGCTSLTTIHIPDGVTDIADGVFADCSGLSDIIIPDSISGIGAEAFRNCSGMRSITLPISVSISSSSFEGVSGLTSVTLTSGTKVGYTYNADSCKYTPWYQSRKNNLVVYLENEIENIGNYSFFGCEGLSSIMLPGSLKSIGSYAFSECTSLMNVIIPDSVTSIASSAFKDCTGLTDIAIGSGVSVIGNNTFSGCTSLTSLVIPDNVTEIQTSAFSGCAGLADITIGNGVTTIGGNAFSGCTGLTSITMPISTSIQGTSFPVNSVTNLTTVVLSKGTGHGFNYTSNTYKYTPWYRSSAESITITLEKGIESVGNYSFYGCSGLCDFVYPEGLTNIGNYAFACCEGLTSVTLSNDGITFGEGVFSGCVGIVDITIEQGVTAIPVGFVSGCTGVTDIRLPDSVTSIGAEAFMGCTGLSGFTIPSSVTQIGDKAFMDCTGLASIAIPNTVTNLGSNVFTRCTGLTTALLPEDLTSISAGLFSSCSGLTSINIPETVTSLGASAFYNCSGLTSITIPDKVSSLGTNCFRSCTGLTSIMIPFGVTTVAQGLCMDCTGLTSVALPDSVTMIDSNAFKGCSSLVGISIPTNVTSIGKEAFYGCAGLTEILIPDGVTSIGVSAFSDCAGVRTIAMPISASVATSAFNNVGQLSSVFLSKGTGAGNVYSNTTYQNTPWYVSRENALTITLEEGIKSIGSYTFYKCAGLTEITLPSSTTSIGSYSFAGCTGLSSITIPGGVSSIAGNAFADSGVVQVTVTEYTYGKTWADGTDYDFVVLHDFNSDHSPLHFAYTDATCIEDGHGEYWVCDGCGRLFSDEDCKNEISEVSVIPAIGHSYVLSRWIWAFDYSSAEAEFVCENDSEHVQKVSATITSTVDPETGKVFLTGTVQFEGTEYQDVVERIIKVSSLELDCSELEITIGDTRQLIVSILPEDADDKSVTWMTNDENIVSVDENGNLTATGVGDAVVTVRSNDGSEITASCNVTVLPVYISSITLDATQLDLFVGDVRQLSATILPENATIRKLEWTTSNEEIVVVDEDGTIICVGEGTAVITVSAMDGSGVSISCTVNVIFVPTEGIYFSDKVSELQYGETYRFVVGFEPENASDKGLVWTSSNEDALTVDETGSVTAVGKGSATITAATADGQFSVSADVTVLYTDVTSVSIEKKLMGMFTGESAELVYTLLPDDASNKAVVFVSSDPSIVSVDENGVLTAHAEGEATITVLAENGTVSSNCDVVVLDNGLYGVTYTVRFDGNGSDSGTMDSLSLTAGESCTLPENAFSRELHVFTGWNTSPDGSGTAYEDREEVINLSTTNGEEVTLYAQWRLVGYTITYVLNGGVNNTANPAYYTGEEEVVLKDPSRTGYTFKGWFSDKACTKQVKKIEKGSTGHKTLYAKWELTKYSIVYKLNGGTSPSDAPTSYTIRSETIVLKTPTRKGYTFDGWYLDSAFTSPVSEIPSGSTGKVTVYAKWTPTPYKIVYKLKGGTNNAANPATYTIEDKVTLKNPKRTGYTFNGWFSDSKYKNKVTSIAAGSTGKKTFYAKWTLKTYTIAFNANGGTGTAPSVMKCKYFSEYELKKNTFTRKGYTFAGWNTKKDGSGTAYSNKEIVSNLTEKDGAQVTLYAQWKLTDYKIKYVLNGGTNNPANPKTYVMTKTVRFKNPTRDGYTFKGWYSDSKFKTKITKIAKGSTGKKTVYAKWEPTVYTINYVLSGGKNSSKNKGTYTIEETVKLYSPTRKGYKFLGWYTDTAFENKISSIPVGTWGDLDLYAKWEPITYKIKFISNGGTGQMATVSVRYDENYILPSCAYGKPCDSVTFKGWSKDKNGSDGVMSAGSSVKNLADTDGKVISLYAIWALPAPDISCETYGPESISIKWSAIDGASSYVIYRSTSATGEYKKIAEVGGEKEVYLNQGLKSEKRYYYKMQAVYKNTEYNCTHYGTMSQSVSAKTSKMLKMDSYFTHSNGSKHFYWHIKNNSDGDIIIYGTGTFVYQYDPYEGADPVLTETMTPLKVTIKPGASYTYHYETKTGLYLDSTGCMCTHVTYDGISYMCWIYKDGWKIWVTSPSLSD